MVRLRPSIWRITTMWIGLIGAAVWAGGPVERDLVCSLAGFWYPAEPDELRGQLKGFFESASLSVPARQDVIGLILPHAGYAYSGPTAAKGLAAAGRRYHRVIVIGPSHRYPAGDFLIVPRVRSFKTPLGAIPIDQQVVDRLVAGQVFRDIPSAFQGENSIEIQLPLLQYHLGDGFKLVPIMAGHCSLQTIRQAAELLKACVDPQTLVIASSDFTHYGRSYGYVPFTDDLPRRIKELDMGSLGPIQAKDPNAFLQYIQRTGATICGYIPVAVLLAMMPPDAKAELIQYTTSGQITGDWSQSVSYMSVAFLGTWPGAKGSGLSQYDKATLLNLARKTIAFYLEQRRTPTLADLGIQVSDALKVPRAAFVTLKRRGQLRGCIGDVYPRRPLYESVIDNAINAAVRDPRFAPVTASELGQLHIEISALTVPEPIDSPEKIRLGVDGIILTKAGRSALFLPQVAPEQGWNIQQTLEHL
ncbi:MAG: AmmeMemoRadiSam system protein B, partial [Sedimentisphaerales bacterium]|nr:AmmeMemoRadiSam system protein B [Sedimentisphaerales bacterium]